MKTAIKIGIIGDYDGRVSHLATDSALQYASAELGLEVRITWVPTESLLSGSDKTLSGYDGLWCSPGSPYKSMTGALNGIGYAREKHIPFLGTCGGFQHAVLEFGRDVLNRKEIWEEGFDPYLPNNFITPLSCSLVGQSRNIFLSPASYMAKIYGSLEVVEKFNCSFGLSEEFTQELDEYGFKVQGADEEGNPRILVLEAQPFYIITLFQPQLSSLPGQSHPLILEYLNICRR
jgi:CTP synthase (UTP-ammonia lyase)